MPSGVVGVVGTTGSGVGSVVVFLQEFIVNNVPIANMNMNIFFI
jgi:hypothetical protein